MLFQKRPATMMILSDNSPIAFKEAYTDLRANLSFLTEKGGQKRIVVASCVADEGKGAVAVNLAMSLAAGGARVVLLDCDLRRPNLHLYLQASNPEDKGLAAILSDTGELKPVGLRQNGFYFLPAGYIPKNPAVLLSSKRMKALLDGLSEHFDYVICAAPPVTAVSDAALLGRMCDGVALVVRQRFAARKWVMEAVKRLNAAEVPVLGTILNDYDLTLERRKGHPYISYGDPTAAK